MMVPVTGKYVLEGVATLPVLPDIPFKSADFKLFDNKFDMV